jgi:diguanylate cyclase (GGDEF)-like protein/PAS domain S-box-containing protein
MPSLQFQPTSTATLSVSQLRRRYIVALSVIALLAILSQAIVQFLIADQQYDSRVVNIAGRQRMLSQKITKLSYYISSAESVDAASSYRKELGETLSLWQRSHIGLLRGDNEMGLPGRNSDKVIELFSGIQPHHEAMVAATTAVLSSSSAAEFSRNIRSIKEHESIFLNGMNDIVFQYDREATTKVEFVKWLEIGLMGITLLVLLLEAAFVFAPAARRIQRDMQEIDKRAKTDLELFFSVSPTPLLLVDNESLSILHANQKATSLLGFSNEEIIKSNLTNFLSADSDINRRFLEKLEKHEILNEYEAVLLDAKGSVLAILVSFRAINFLGQPVYVIGITNITELKKAQQTLEHHATFDDMTGLMNRRTGLMMLGKSMARLKRTGGKLAVCFVDVDGLKTVNDSFGHAEGDWLIRTVAEVLIGISRSSDAVIRLGGDEFLLLLQDCSPEEGIRLLARAEMRLKEIEATQHKPFPIDFSYGVTIYAPEKHATPDELISEADSLMYQAKQESKRLRLAKGGVSTSA